MTPWYPIPEEIEHLVSQIEAFYKNFVLDMTLLCDFHPEDYNGIAAWYTMLQRKRLGASRVGPTRLMDYLFNWLRPCPTVGQRKVEYNYSEDPKDWTAAFLEEARQCYWQDVLECCKLATMWKMPEEVKKECEV